MKRDKRIALDLREHHRRLEEWQREVEALESEAEGQGAFAHRNLYSQIALELVTAHKAAKRAADLMDPDITDPEDFAA